jgi:hypothetical protein
MKGLIRAALACLLAAPSGAEVVAAVPSLTVSSMSVSVEGKPTGQVAVGTSIGLSEGKPLQVMVWGGAGAIVGSMAGPMGTVVGAAAGAAFGLVFSAFIVPRYQPGMGKATQVTPPPK